MSSKKVTAGKADKKTASTAVTFNKVDADKVTKDDLTAIAKDVAAAVKKGDSTLTGDKGAEVVKKFEDNIKKNPNADADAVEKESEKAQETAKEDKSDAKAPETSAARRITGTPVPAAREIPHPRRMTVSPIASRAETLAPVRTRAARRRRMTPRRMFISMISTILR